MSDYHEDQVPHVPLHYAPQILDVPTPLALFDALIMHTSWTKFFCARRLPSETVQSETCERTGHYVSLSQVHRIHIAETSFAL